MSPSRDNLSFSFEVYDFLNLIFNFPFHLKLIQRTLKNISIILLLLCVSFTFTATASGGGGEKEEKSTDQEQEPKRQSLLPRLDGEPENGGYEYDETDNEEIELQDEEIVAESDSTQSSFRKFNFIFYFLYKFKYENDARFGTIPQELESN